MLSKVIQETKMWKLLKLAIFLALHVNAGPRVSIELISKSYENRSYLVKEYSEPINASYKEMSPDSYKLVVDLIFRNMDIFFRVNLFQQDQHYRALKLGVDILNLYTQTGNDEALNLLRTLIARDEGRVRIDPYNLLKDVSFKGIEKGDVWNDPNPSNVRSDLINRYPEITNVIEELIPQNSISRLIGYVTNWWHPTAKSQKPEDNPKLEGAVARLTETTEKLNCRENSPIKPIRGSNANSSQGVVESFQQSARSKEDEKYDELEYFLMEDTPPQTTVSLGPKVTRSKEDEEYDELQYFWMNDNDSNNSNSGSLTKHLKLTMTQEVKELIQGMKNEIKSQNLELIQLRRENFDIKDGLNKLTNHQDGIERLFKKERDPLTKEEQQNTGLDCSFAEKLAQQSKQLQELAAIKQQMDEKNEELDSLRMSDRKKDETINQMKETLDNLRKELEQQNPELHALQKDNRQKERAIRYKDQELDLLRISNEEKDETIRQMHANFIEIKQGMRDEFARSLEQKDQELDSLRTSNREKDEIIQQKHEEFAPLQMSDRNKKQLQETIDNLATQLRQRELGALKNRNSGRSSSPHSIFRSSLKGFLDQQPSDRSSSPRRNIRSTSQFASEKDQKRVLLQKQDVSHRDMIAFNSNMQHSGDPTLAMEPNPDSQIPDISFAAAAAA